MIKDPFENPLSQNELPDFPSSVEKIPETREELLKMIENREVMISKALYFEDGEPACFMDVRGREELTPGFITPAPQGTPSSVALEQIFDPCGKREEDKLMTMNIQNFVLEGTQVAHPGIMFGAGCLFGFMEEVIKLHDYPRENPTVKPTMYISLTAISVAGTRLEPAATTFRAVGAVFARMLGFMTVGYVSCGNTVDFVIEMTGVREGIDQEIEREKLAEELSRLRKTHFTTNQKKAKKTTIIANTEKQQIEKNDEFCRQFITQNSLWQVASYKESICQPSSTGYEGSGTSECLCVYNDLRNQGNLLYWKEL